ncbi:HPt (histidine-containing phosphotransfer) domain-containing protein [Rhodobium orientis]|uniref:HPt domain-containing protein n=1 Tax=Rhodobium orientis TaxID=34017 RepID=A0A327JGD7_9HYPH|nr:Hpt domain-containing protein [Rhodobium orientis]MBB4303180.1 HPt (histidine-containing phosphotransfer) domain-containing protein [Rhodobium orientis]MBK5951719.1 hypothetical protein [Rhodobium orientis]RAI24991.1 hypothetical protein CH339_20125 [Rhodobium orientis]
MAATPVSPALKRVATRFAARLPSRFDQLEGCAKALSVESYASEMDALHVSLHEFAGIAPLLGYKELGDRARDAETLILELKARSAPPTREDLAALRSMAMALRNTVPADGA